MLRTSAPLIGALGFSMKVIEVLVNGHRRALIGNPAADTIDFSIRIHPLAGISCVSHAITESETGEPVCEHWPELNLIDTDRIEIRFVEVENLSDIDQSHPGTHRHSTDGTLEIACSICGKTASEVEQIIGGQTGNICNECVEFCSDLIQANKEN